MSQNIESKLSAHDRHQFELKLGYTLKPSLAGNKYNIELYMFIPKSLGINTSTYGKNDFFNDIQGYIRFKTPAFTFDELANPENNLSPLTRISKILATTKDRKRLIAEMKLYACTVRVALRTAITQARRQIRKEETLGFKEAVAAFCGGLTRSLDGFRALKPQLEKPDIHEDVRTACRHVDEYIGIAVDGLLNSFHNSVLASSFDKKLIEEAGSVIKPVIISEYGHRRECGYAVYEAEGENELFLYRKGILKKIVTSILFLNTYTQEGVTIAKDIIFAVSAGIAMVIATAVTLWAGYRFGATSIPFVLAIVMGYMVKDRVKDWLKLIFSKKMTRWFSDYKTDIIDPATGRKIGTCKQAFSFIGEKKVPNEIMSIRRQNTPQDFWLTEDIIKYEKDVFLKPRAILKSHTRLKDVTDIIRFNVGAFLERMDETHETRRALNPANGEVTSFRFARVYHINLVLKIENDIKRIRLILNQNGIVRIEVLGTHYLSVDNTLHVI